MTVNRHIQEILTRIQKVFYLDSENQSIEQVRRPISKAEVASYIGQHRHWVSMQDRYTLVHQGPESFQKWIDQKFQEYWDKNHPAAAKTDGAGVQGAGGAGDSTSLVEPASV